MWKEKNKKYIQKTLDSRLL